MCRESGCASLSWHARKMQRTIRSMKCFTDSCSPHSFINSNLNHHLFFAVALLRLWSKALLAEHHTCPKETRCVLPSHVSWAVQALWVPHSLQSLTCHCGNHHRAAGTWAHLSLVGSGFAYGDTASWTTTRLSQGCFRAGKVDSAHAQGKVALRCQWVEPFLCGISRAVYHLFLNCIEWLRINHHDWVFMSIPCWFFLSWTYIPII